MKTVRTAIAAALVTPSSRLYGPALVPDRVLALALHAMPTRFCMLAVSLTLFAGLATQAAAQPLPALEGPVPGTPFVAATSFDLGVVGYEQLEYFVAGTATAYSPTGAFLSDGQWDATPSSTTEYRTRIVVHRPTKRGRFNGTVVVEWLNVSGGVDAGPDWIGLHTELIRKGYAWVGVSAQKVGIDGGPAIPGLPPNHLKLVDPVRYGGLVHPGDSFSYDMYSQVARLLRGPAETNPLGDLRLKTLLAVGESQSAFRMVTYVNAVHPLVRLFDGFLIHSRGASGAPLTQDPLPPTAMPAVAFLREDVGVPVLTFETETDLGFLGFASARQPDSEFHRLWEVAGTAHADLYTVAVGMTDTGRSPEAAVVREETTPLEGLIECAQPLNAGPQHFVLKAALHALHDWVKRGKAPDSAPLIELESVSPLVIRRDEHGNAVGGIRTPYVDAPIATLRGDGQTGSVLCSLFGTTDLFDEAKLRALYPSARAYRSAVKQSTRSAVKAGFIRKPDAKLITRAAKDVDVGS
jgi:hypothetical protein